MHARFESDNILDGYGNLMRELSCCRLELHGWFSVKTKALMTFKKIATFLLQYNHAYRMLLGKRGLKSNCQNVSINERGYAFITVFENGNMFLRVASNITSMA